MYTLVLSAQWKLKWQEKRFYLNNLKILKQYLFLIKCHPFSKYNFNLNIRVSIKILLSKTVLQDEMFLMWLGSINFARWGVKRRRTFLPFWWNWRDIPPSGHLEDIQEEPCRQNELSSAQTHKELETTGSLLAHCPRPSASLWLQSPTQQKQKTK